MIFPSFGNEPGEQAQHQRRAVLSGNADRACMVRFLSENGIDQSGTRTAGTDLDEQAGAIGMSCLDHGGKVDRVEGLG